MAKNYKVGDKVRGVWDEEQGVTTGTLTLLPAAGQTGIPEIGIQYDDGDGAPRLKLFSEAEFEAALATGRDGG